MDIAIICLFCLIGLVLGSIMWYIIPWVKLNQLIVWLNRNRQINHCEWISDVFQSLLCVTGLKQCSLDNFILIKTKNRISIESIVRFYVYIKLTVEVNGFQDEKTIKKINEDFVVLFVYKNFCWRVVSLKCK